MTDIVLNLDRLRPSDLEELMRLSIDTYYTAFVNHNTPENMQNYLQNAFSAEKLMEELQNPDSEFYFLKHEDQTIAYLKINFNQAQTDLNDPRAIEIERIYVISEYQGKKIGQYLLDCAIDMAKERGMDYIWLGVWEKNDGARRFYVRNEFKQIGSHPFMMGNDKQTDLIMKLPLS